MRTSRLGLALVSLVLCCGIASAEIFYPIPDDLAGPSAANGQVGIEPRFIPRRFRTLTTINREPSETVMLNASIYQMGRLQAPPGYTIGADAQLPREASLYNSIYGASTIRDRGWISNQGRSLFPIWGVNRPAYITGGRPSFGGFGFNLGSPVGYAPYAPYVYRAEYGGMVPDSERIGRSPYGAAGTNPAQYQRHYRKDLYQTTSHREKRTGDLPRGYQHPQYNSRHVIVPADESGYHRLHYSQPPSYGVD